MPCTTPPSPGRARFAAGHDDPVTDATGVGRGRDSQRPTTPSHTAAAATAAAAAATADDDDDEEEDEDACLSVVLCPSDTSVWSKLTCALGFVASFVCDGVCASMFLLDARFGAAELLPPLAHTVEHLAVALSLGHLIEPFSCAYINWYGFRRCLFVGSVLSIMWITFLCFIENAFFLGNYYICMAVVGGIGMGMIKTSFLVLLSSLFVLNRHKAHLTGHLGSFTGMLIVPPLTEFVMLKCDWRVALYLHFGLVCTTIGFWLLVATPWPFKVQVTERDPLFKYPSVKSMRLLASHTARDEDYLPRKNRFPTIQDLIGEYEELQMDLLTDTTPLIDYRRRVIRNERRIRHVTWVNQKLEDRGMCIQNVTNMFEDRRMVGSRPMYRDDIFFDGNITALKGKLKFNEYVDYLMATTRVFTVADLNAEKRRMCCVIWPTAISRVLNSMFDLSIFCETKFLLFAACEALIHASCLIPFIFIKGPLGQKSSPEAVITLIAGCVGLLYGRGFGYWFHQTSSNVVPPYHVSLVLIANGLAIQLCVTDNFAKLIAYYGSFGCLFGYYKSIQNSTMYAVFPLKKFNNVRGYISVVRALSLFLGILFSLKILRTADGSLSTNNHNVYIFAGVLMAAGGLCVFLLQRPSSATLHGQRLDHGRDRSFQLQQTVCREV